MRAKEFITEGNTGKISDDVARALPGTWALPNLLNQDPYKQYRFSLTLAAAGPQQSTETVPAKETEWGENMIVSSYSEGEREIFKKAVKQAGEPSKEITTTKSEEAKDVNKASPIAVKKKNRYGI